MKKFTSMLLVIAMMSCLLMGADAASTNGTVVAGPNTTITIQDGADIRMSRADVVWIPKTSYVSSAAYENSFTCTPSAGNAVNIWVNNRSNYTLTVRVTVDGYVYSGSNVNLAAGQQHTYVLQNVDTSAMGNSVSVYLGSAVGDTNIEVSARQYNR